VLLFHGFTPAGTGRTPNGPVAKVLAVAFALLLADVVAVTVAVAAAVVVEELAELPEQPASEAASAASDTHSAIEILRMKAPC
jgi:hypothetical protein